MVKDMYAIYETYATGNTMGSAGINNTERGNPNLSFRPVGQGSTYGDLGQSNEEVKQPVATIRGKVAPEPGNTVFNLRGAGAVTASTIRTRLGKLLELMHVKAAQGDYDNVFYMIKDLQFYTQANQEVNDALKNKK